eukprot:scaffold682_cov105-Skeletonema_dohrnii-CCMP3373.AAC.2
MNAIIITKRNSSTMGYLIIRCITLCLTVAILASTSWAFAPPSTHVAFGFRARIAPSLRGKQLCLSSNTLDMDRTRNNSSYEDSLESSVIDTEERNDNNGVAFISSGTRDDEHEACTIDDDDDEHDDEIDELFKSLLHKVGKYNAEAVTLSYKDANNNNTQPISMLRQAFNIAREAHKNQCRKSGEPYITHPLGVAHIIADMELDLASLLTALLHDTVEDTNVTLGDIEEMFGGEISQCVDGVTKIAKIAFTSYEEQQSENYRKLILAMSKDIVSWCPFVCIE